MRSVEYGVWRPSQHGNWRSRAGKKEHGAGGSETSYVPVFWIRLACVAFSVDRHYDRSRSISIYVS